MFSIAAPVGEVSAVIAAKSVFSASIPLICSCFCIFFWANVSLTAFISSSDKSLSCTIACSSSIEASPNLLLSISELPKKSSSYKPLALAESIPASVLASNVSAIFFLSIPIADIVASLFLRAVTMAAFLIASLSLSDIFSPASSNKLASISAASCLILLAIPLSFSSICFSASSACACDSANSPGFTSIASAIAPPAFLPNQLPPK